MPRTGFMVSSSIRCPIKSFKPAISPMQKDLVVSCLMLLSSPSSSSPSLPWPDPLGCDRLTPRALDAARGFLTAARRLTPFATATLLDGRVRLCALWSVWLVWAERTLVGGRRQSTASLASVPLRVTTMLTRCTSICRHHVRLVTQMLQAGDSPADQLFPAILVLPVCVDNKIDRCRSNFVIFLLINLGWLGTGRWTGLCVLPYLG